MPRKKKSKNSKADDLTRRIKRGYSKEFGFLHIPKTGGSSLVSYGSQLVAMGYPFPVHFGHSWRITKIKELYPKIKLAFILRDPLERMISGYNSRLRQGRPTYNSLWTPAEAAVMAMLPSPRHLLDAMLADDEFSVSAVTYAKRSVSHLRWNYRFYFNSPQFVKNHASMFGLIGRMDRFDQFAEDLAVLSGAPREKAIELCQRKHSSAEKSSSVLDNYSESDLIKLRARLKTEYAIYDELCLLGEASGSLGQA